MSNINTNDIDPIETQEWLDSLNSVLTNEGKERAKFIIDSLLAHAGSKNIELPSALNTPYVNTISEDQEVEYPGDIALEKKIQAAIRWNAIMMVQHAQKKDLDLGGHLASYQSVSDMWEVGFNHFFRAATDVDGGDLVYFQGHSSPGVYARAYVEGRLTEEQAGNLRQEAFVDGLSSYPHPHLMPTFWQFPTVSMGLGSLTAIYQARYLKYLHSRGLKDTSNQTVWAFLGDGECDEVESKGGISIAGREGLDNLVFVVNCNLQRLDGPVFGNGKIVNELEGIFAGAKWKVIKLLWGSSWQKLLDRDTSGKLLTLLSETVDGDFQNFNSKDGAYYREHLFSKYPETLELVKDLSDEELSHLVTGGHDFKKIYNAFKVAKETKGQPVVILAQTIKGIGLGKAAQGLNIAHQVKKLNVDSLKGIRDEYQLNLTDEQVEKLDFVKFAEGTAEYNYLHGQRKALGGYLPQRRERFDVEFEVPSIEDLKLQHLLEKQERPISTTLGYVRYLTALLENEKVGKHIVPIVADESRTFGMEGLFRKVGIYSPFGQKYTPQDKASVAFYKEDTNGQLLQEGINELGATASWLAAATSYSTNNVPTIPFFIYYSMFGFQRVADLLWLACDQKARGFLIGATSGRTTLNGEGLQHEDGHSHIISSVMPSVKSYDPAYVYELAVILEDGINRMYGPAQENVYYYITTLNETYEQPAMPVDAKEGIVKGIYKLQEVEAQGEQVAEVQLLGSGSILRHVILAAEILAKYGIKSHIHSVTSFTELARDGQRCEHKHRLNPFAAQDIPYVTSHLQNLPTVAATDYVRAFAEQIRAFLPTANYNTLGTDGYGRSDSRENLRRFFEVDAPHIALASVYALLRQRTLKPETAKQIITDLGIDPNKPYSLDL
ncbi:pyruvate dehydrogenase (acetyl-transferring), homodimeric type [Psittacicella hinzii]|uniref:Pyruvate dehydrogenase E1 component n=1 Tax=Psittacicella hinzii TaxID=2028575 RepID=A0A3A1Y9B3_9GAMM|nr:pyruvate dehydrogenase (acetyl-transferring), homodimeric type [Psittacicella hinzii]RIY33788.1 pyruvate dehydrogenase (acetyl-transferring), homodimeric type [Psittacicella hinzii]